MIRKFINIISVENKRLLLRFLAMIFFVTACIQKFDYEPERIDENILVVSGGITNQPVVQTIMLSRTTPYGTGTYTSEPGAMIVIIENRKAIDTCIEVRDGIYQFDGAKIQPKPGNRYAIEITTREKKVYESDQEMPQILIESSGRILLFNICHQIQAS